MNLKRLLFVMTLTGAMLIGILHALSPYAAQAGGVVGSPCDEVAFTAALGGGGNVSFNCGPSTTILILNLKTITRTTTIDGGGQITLTGGLATRLFNVTNGVTLTLRNIVLDRFAATGTDGGAISSNGALVLENTKFEYSQTDIDHAGGAIFSAGPVYIRNSTFRKNTGGSAGAIFINNSNARAEIESSFFSDNQAVNTTTGYGGAIWVGTQAK